MSPVALKLWGKVSMQDGAHPPALREAAIDLDRNLALDARGLPVCDPGPQRDVRDPGAETRLRKVCRASIVGAGRAAFEIAFPGLEPIRESSRVTLYNYGVRDGVTRIAVVTSIDVPVPSMIVVWVQVNRIHEGRYGWRAVAEVPVIAGGSGSLLGFNLRIKRRFRYKGAPKSYLTASCPDGSLRAEITSLFENESQTPGVPSQTTLESTVISPCRSTR